MSKYRIAKTKIKDFKLLQDVLHSLEIPFELASQNGKEKLSLYGYEGDRRPETADLVVRRAFIGSAANDLGFKRKSDGTVEAIISEFDQQTNGGVILDRVLTEYNVRDHTRKLQRAGYQVSRRKNPNTGQIELVAERRGILQATQRRQAVARRL